MDANPFPMVWLSPKGRVFLTLVAGLIVLGVAVGCASAPTAPLAIRSVATPTALLAAASAPAPIAAPTARAGGPPVPKTRSFSPSQHPVRRNVTLSHLDDTVEFNAVPLPSDLPNAAPPGKGISKILNWIIEPEVKIKGALATSFSSPLTVNADFTAQDSAGAARGADGKPRISLFTAWKQGSTWKWEKLATTVECADKECTRGTLTARITNLHPGDPVGDGFD